MYFISHKPRGIETGSNTTRSEVEPTPKEVSACCRVKYTTPSNYETYINDKISNIRRMSAPNRYTFDSSGQQWSIVSTPFSNHRPKGGVKINKNVFHLSM